MKIQVMPKHMADLIAAGEVVERPASVIKELAENAIDAGASALTIEIKGGGSAYMRVSDNGSGIAKEDLPLAFQTHATSKIYAESDMEHIATLGFRGEALASICAVSRVEVLTLAEGEDIGSSYRISGGEEQAFESAGCPRGTTIIVRDLFYNTPARMKFLKRDVTEGNYVAAVVDRIALSHPEIKITFIREGKQVFSTNGDGKLYSAIYAVFGGAFAKSLLPIDYTLGGIHASGYISKPTACRANRSMQYFFINGRQVKNVTAMSALENAYKNAVMVGKVPACVMHIEMPVEAVDVNVHPAKTEVRFADEKAVFDAVYYACKNALMEKDTPKQVSFSKNDFLKKQPVPEQQRLEKAEAVGAAPRADFWQREKADTFRREAEAAREKKDEAFRFTEQTYIPPVQTAAASAPSYASKRAKIDIEFDEEPVQAAAPQPKQETAAPARQATPAPAEQVPSAPAQQASEPATPAAEQTIQKTEQATPAPTQAAAEAVSFQVIGEVFKTYIIVERGNEVLFIDKHAAHERMLFEQLRAQAHREPQMLLEPLPLTLSKEDYDAVISHLEQLKDSGFIVEDFGMGSLVVRAYPMVLEQSDVREILEETAGYLRENRRDISTEAADWLFHNVACRAAIKAGNITTRYEMEGFVQQLLSMPEIRYCPHGRPVMITMSKYAFEKQFGRTGSLS